MSWSGRAGDCERAFTGLTNVALDVCWFEDHIYIRRLYTPPYIAKLCF